MQGRDFTSKRIAVVGPAAPLEGTHVQLDASQFDYLIVMNRLLHSKPENVFGAPAIGKVLFHNLEETGERSAGNLSKNALFEEHVKYVVFPHATYLGVGGKFYRASNTLSKFGVELKVLPFSFYNELVEDLGGYAPTTGLAAIAYLLRCPVHSVSISGFTFFQTGYQKEYNNSLEANTQPWVWAKHTGLHDPDREVEVARRRVNEARKAGKQVCLDASLQTILTR